MNAPQFITPNAAHHAKNSTTPPPSPPPREANNALLSPDTPVLKRWRGMDVTERVRLAAALADFAGRDIAVKAAEARLRDGGMIETRDGFFWVKKYTVIPDADGYALRNNLTGNAAVARHSDREFLKALAHQLNDDNARRLFERREGVL